MSKPIKKIGLFLILIIVLPIIFLTYRELSSLNEDEKILEKIYKNQLDVIIFSVNQYSEDVVRSWSFRMQSIIENSQSSKKDFDENLNSFYSENSVIHSMFISDSSLAVNKTFIKSENGTIFEKDDWEIKQILKNNGKLISRLYKYKSSGFTKLEPLNSMNIKGTQAIVFVLDDRRLCGFVIDPRYFVNDVLSGKIQSVAREELSVAVFDSVKNVNVYSTETGIVE